MAQTVNITANGSTDPIELQGLISVAGVGTFGGGTLTIEASFDGGANYFALTDAGGLVFSLTANGAKNIEVGKGVLIRGTLSGATSPDINIVFTDIRWTSKL